MFLTVHIPTHARADKLARCVGALARQTLPPDRFEVLVGFDGPDPETRRRAEAAWRDAGGRPGGLRTFELERRGYIPVRAALLDAAAPGLPGPVTLVSLNDDVVPAPGCLAVHAREAEARHAAGAPAVIVGHSPFIAPPADGVGDTLLNRLARETDLVFFYAVMNTPEALAEPGRDWGFRHCFGLNFSAPLALVREAGGIPPLEHTYGYDDIELAHRLTRRGLPVLYRPAASAPHDHLYHPIDLIERERALGRAAWAYAGVNPGFARDVFGRDIRDGRELDAAAESVSRDGAAAPQMQSEFAAMAARPGAAVAPGETDVLRSLLRSWRPLKRWLWSRGLLEAAGRTDP